MRNIIRRVVLRRRPGPPVLTFCGTNAGSNSGSVNTYTSIAIGNAYPTRLAVFAIIQAAASDGNKITSATVNGSSTGVNIYNAYVALTSQIGLDLVTCPVPTGTTATLAATYNNSIFSTQGAAAFSIDTATLASQIPVISGVNNNSSATSITSTYTAPQGGSAILTWYGGFGITNGSQNITTPNTCGIALDATIADALFAHANNVGPIGGAQVSVSWTTSGAGYIAEAIFR